MLKTLHVILMNLQCQNGEKNIKDVYHEGEYIILGERGGEGTRGEEIVFYFIRRQPNK